LDIYRDALGIKKLERFMVALNGERRTLNLKMFSTEDVSLSFGDFSLHARDAVRQPNPIHEGEKEEPHESENEKDDVYERCIGDLVRLGGESGHGGYGRRKEVG
jgi:hypothetical protein